MALHSTPEDHDANPPETWEVVKAGERLWHLRQRGAEYPFDSFTTKKAAEAARTNGSAARLYHEEGRWFAGETPPGWKSWAQVRAEREAREARLAEKARAS